MIRPIINRGSGRRFFDKREFNRYGCTSRLILVEGEFPTVRGDQFVHEIEADPLVPVGAGGVNRLFVFFGHTRTIISDLETRGFTVTLTVTPAPGADPVNLLNTTLTWIGPNGTAYLTHADVPGGDGDFVVAAVKDNDGSMPWLNDPDDRATLTIDADSMGQALRPGATASIKVSPASGATTTVQVTVPQSLDDRTSVAL